MKNGRFSLIIGLLILFLTVKSGVVFATIQDAEDLINTRQKVNLEKAQQLLMDLLEGEPNNVQALCLMAKAHFYYGDKVDKDRRVEVFQQGQAFAERAVKLDPHSPDAHYWSAALMGRVGEAQGIFQSLFMIRPMQEHLEQVLKLDEDYAWAYYVLSRLYYDTPRKPLSVGDKEKALEYAWRAVELDPCEPEFTVHLGKLLVAQKRMEEAEEVLLQALSEPSIEREPCLKQEAEELLRSIQNP